MYDYINKFLANTEELLQDYEKKSFCVIVVRYKGEDCLKLCYEDYI